MNKKMILESADRLKQVSESTADEYQSKAGELIARMNNVMLGRPDLEELVGKNNIDMMRDNHANHVRFLASILKNYNAAVLVNTVLWVFRAYRSHGFSTNYWAAQLNNWIMITEESLSPGCYHEVYPYYEWMQVNIPVFVKLSEKEPGAPDPLH